jgi:hypothetical protein
MHFLEHAIEILLGESQNNKHLGYCEARAPRDAWQHVVMRPAKPERGGGMIGRQQSR